MPFFTSTFLIFFVLSANHYELIIVPTDDMEKLISCAN